jgi:hypothetical protein
MKVEDLNKMALYINGERTDIDIRVDYDNNRIDLVKVKHKEEKPKEEGIFVDMDKLRRNLSPGYMRLPRNYHNRADVAADIFGQ